MQEQLLSYVFRTWLPPLFLPLRHSRFFQINHRHKAWLENPIAFKSRTGWCKQAFISSCLEQLLSTLRYRTLLRKGWTVAITTKRRRKTVIEWLCSASIRTSFRIFSNIYPASGALATRAFLSIVRSQL